MLSRIVEGSYLVVLGTATRSATEHTPRTTTYLMMRLSFVAKLVIFDNSSFHLLE